MIQTVLLPVLHGLLYIAAACLIFIVITPRFLFEHNRRKPFFVLILAVLTYFYIGFESIDPLVYALHLTPISLCLAALYEGAIPGVATWAAFVVCGIFAVGNDWLPTLAASTLMLAGGLLLHYRVAEGSRGKMSLLSVLLALAYLAAYIPLQLLVGFETPVRQLLLVVASTFVSSIITSYVYFYVKHQERFQKELLLSEKYQLIGQLAASISHEIRNPLTTARGFLQMMGKEGLSQEAFERYRTYAFEGIDHANGIITDYLNFSKPTVEQPALLNVREEVEGVIPWLQPFSVLSNITLDIHHLIDEPAWIRGEPKKFQQCLLNVMKNAIESMKDGGILSVHTRLEKSHVQILIRDTGVGMSSAQVKRLGIPYFTTKDTGTGLGLMVVMSLVKEMDGKILFRSKPDQGTICEMHFPLAQPK
ncbi:HAMP domain-containing sensor histidine kinase [Paenibacillus arenilitoris]|uniref:HAMP domain-containing sensor histidine kinase n=1 Tax=Paenibacillus arenilitoris TaxID=2772299 RepID=UPI00295BB359|nr:HAMP domain-containing sensor histidine kinase [Paenibacillus arenilitoris]